MYHVRVATDSESAIDHIWIPLKNETVWKMYTGKHKANDKIVTNKPYHDYFLETIEKAQYAIQDKMYACE